MAIDWNYKETASFQESHGCALYCISFNAIHPSLSNVFAVVGKNTPSEEFYVCDWSADPATSGAILLLAGRDAVVRVIDTLSGTLLCSLGGHGQPVNDIAVHPVETWVAATASKDHSIRIWNLKTGCCVMQLQGLAGHSNEVLSLDWRRMGRGGHGKRADWTLVSAGMDSSVKTWDLEPHWELLEMSCHWTPGDREFPMRCVRYPTFSSEHIHTSYVDCVRWFGRLLVSKSVDNCVLVWKLTEGTEPKQAVALQTLALEDCAGVWWLRFALGGPEGRLLVAGTASGRVLVFDVGEIAARPLLSLRASSGQLVRQAAISSCGRFVGAAHEEGWVTVFARERREAQEG
ncbi:hypothetical protein H632_c131p1 [Helicosporidium sp. ATCC 50920]|nr:hypothetical protein H632_c131p1 [Helicosporidium sp. ATCC 50920]|eukprot:KDD76710.1 hypothetical protein H632_c131p1 [Helicosporidium sp. ATCC 50920]